MVHASIQALFVIIWGLVRIRHKKYAPNIVLLYIVNNCIWTVLQTKKIVPEFMLSDDLKPEETKILVTIVSMTAINYTTWRSTFLLFTFIVVPMQYFKIRIVNDLRYDPYTRQP
jgi:hypothetical protein